METFLTVLRYVLMGLLALDSVIIVVSIMLQESKSAGLGALGGMQESYWNKNAGRSYEGLLNKISTIGVIAFFVIAFVLQINF